MTIVDDLLMRLLVTAMLLSSVCFETGYYKAVWNGTRVNLFGVVCRTLYVLFSVVFYGICVYFILDVWTIHVHHY